MSYQALAARYFVLDLKLVSISQSRSGTAQLCFTDNAVSWKTFLITSIQSRNPLLLVRKEGEYETVVLPSATTTGVCSCDLAFALWILIVYLKRYQPPEPCSGNVGFCHAFSTPEFPCSEIYNSEKSERGLLVQVFLGQSKGYKREWEQRPSIHLWPSLPRYARLKHCFRRRAGGTHKKGYSRGIEYKQVHRCTVELGHIKMMFY